MILYLQAKTLERMPLVIFGSLTVLGGLLALMLPETQGQALPDNIPELSDTQGPDRAARSTDPIVTRL